MKTPIFYTVNAGVYLGNKDSGIMIDCLHRGDREGFSPLPIVLEEQIQRGNGLFEKTSALFYTHQHSDHFDLVLHRQAAAVIIKRTGNRPFSNLTSDERLMTCMHDSRKGIEVTVLPCPHDGKDLARISHCILLVSLNSEQFLLAGDAKLAEDNANALQPYIHNKLTAVFLNPYHIHDRGAQELLRRIRPERVLLYHLPEKDKDQFHFHEIARAGIKRFPDDLPKVELIEHMHWIDGKKEES